MPRHPLRFFFRPVFTALVITGLPFSSLACSPDTPETSDMEGMEEVEEVTEAYTTGPGEPTLEEVRRATERFQDVEVALEEGYVRDPFDICDTAEMLGQPAALGAMGVHYVRMDLLGIGGPPDPRVNGTGTHTDFLEPSVLIYEPQSDGSLELVAVENLAFADAWEAAGHTQPPSFHGVSYDFMENDPDTEADEAHMFEPHWDRHVWLFRENPNGIFAQFNPDVTCEHHDGAEHWH